jgi:hypothetical protein
MGRAGVHDKSFRETVRARSTAELMEIYRHPEGYDGRFVALLLEELVARGVEVEGCRSVEDLAAARTRRQSSEELLGVYSDAFARSAAERDAAGEELGRRGVFLPVGARRRAEKAREEGKRGSMVVSGYVLAAASIVLPLCGLASLVVALTYLRAKVHTPDGVFYKYDAGTRQSGGIMLLVLVAALVIFIASMTRGGGSFTL